MAMSECRKFDKITNCAIYRAFSDMSGTNDRLRIGCNRCLTNYYLNPDVNVLFTESTGVFISDKCIVRTYLDSNCLNYVANEDKC